MLPPLLGEGGFCLRGQRVWGISQRACQEPERFRIFRPEGNRGCQFADGADPSAQVSRFTCPLQSCAGGLDTLLGQLTPAFFVAIAAQEALDGIVQIAGAAVALIGVELRGPQADFVELGRDGAPCARALGRALQPPPKVEARIVSRLSRGCSGCRVKASNSRQPKE